MSINIHVCTELLPVDGVKLIVSLIFTKNRSNDLIKMDPLCSGVHVPYDNGHFAYQLIVILNSIFRLYVLY